MARKGKFDEAISKLSELYEIYPTYAQEAPIISGIYLYINGKYKEAKDAWLLKSPPFYIGSGKHIEVYVFPSYAALMSYKNKEELELDFNSYLQNDKVMGSFTWDDIIEQNKNWFFLLEGEVEKAREGFRG